jgi:hypothetical protein
MTTMYSVWNNSLLLLLLLLLLSNTTCFDQTDRHGMIVLYKNLKFKVKM